MFCLKLLTQSCNRKMGPLLAAVNAMTAYEKYFSTLTAFPEPGKINCTSTGNMFLSCREHMFILVARITWMCKSVLCPHLHAYENEEEEKSSVFFQHQLHEVLSVFSFIIISKISPNPVLREEIHYHTNHSCKIRLVPT